MSAEPIEDLGPIDYLVVEFPSDTSNFRGEVASELAVLSATELIRVLDVLILVKDADGDVDAFELDDLDEVDELRELEAGIADILAADDVGHLARAMEPDTTAGVVVWENTWCAPFASAVRRAGGQLIANGRIPVESVLATLETVLQREPDMPLRSAHIQRRGVIGRPVSRARASAGTTAAFVRGVERRQSQRAARPDRRGPGRDARRSPL